MKELKYKGYVGSVDLSVDDGVLHGKLLYIGDLVTYEAENATGLVEAFHEAVDDYLTDCKAKGVSPDTPYKGSFNVRIKPELHRELAETARSRGRSLNEYIAGILSCHKHVELAERFETNGDVKFVLVSSISGRSGRSVAGERKAGSKEVLETKPKSKTPAFFQWQTPSDTRH